MSRNQGKSADQEGHVRKRAHAIWEKEGRPHGKEKEHWEKAVQELRNEAERPISAALTKKKQLGGAKSSNDKSKRPTSR